jgi:hypothetical protein
MKRWVAFGTAQHYKAFLLTGVRLGKHSEGKVSAFNGFNDMLHIIVQPYSYIGIYLYRTRAQNQQKHGNFSVRGFFEMK